MKNLAEVSKDEQVKFINSFDRVLCDLDGVIWIYYKPFPGVIACINSLKQLGKTVHYVSNNSTAPVELTKDILDKCGLVTDVEDVTTPILAIMSYLKEIKFNKNKELYVISVTKVKEILKRAGFLVADDGPQEIPETMAGITSNIGDNTNVGGVFIDYDINVNLIKLQKAVTYLRREDCIFVAGAGDSQVPIPNYGTMIGPHYFVQPISDVSGRKPHQIGKPHLSYNEFIVKRFKIDNPDRVLFIGDSVNEDLAFATKCGYQKLLVLSGITTQDDVNKWNYPEEYRPPYYVDGLNEFYNIIKNCFRDKL